MMWKGKHVYQNRCCWQKRFQMDGTEIILRICGMCVVWKEKMSARLSLQCSRLSFPKCIELTDQTIRYSILIQDSLFAGNPVSKMLKWMFWSIFMYKCFFITCQNLLQAAVAWANLWRKQSARCLDSTMGCSSHSDNVSLARFYCILLPAMFSMDWNFLEPCFFLLPRASL